MTPEEAEKQYKREKLMRGAIVKCLEKQGPFLLEELPKVLESATPPVKGFSPKICGYSTLKKFIKSQPRKYMKYDKATGMVNPGKGTSASGSGSASSSSSK